MAAAPAPPVRRRRRWLRVVLGLALALAAALFWASRPAQVSALALSQAGRALGLEIRASGASAYRLRGVPMLEVRDVSVREPGAAQPLLRARRAFLSLPWSTLRAAGASLDAERIELDAPQLDLAALDHWLSARPPSTEPLRLPRLERGARVREGRVIGAGWSVEAVDLELGEFAPERPLDGRMRGRVVSGATALPFDLAVRLQRPALQRGLGLAGRVSVETADWRLPMRLRLGALLHAGADGIGLDRLRAQAAARYRSGQTDLPFGLGLAGPLRYRDGELLLQPMGVALRPAGADSPVAALDAGGRFGFGQTLRLHWQGRIAGWPQAWPALPPPLGQSTAPLPFRLDYAGRPDGADPVALWLQRDSTEFDGRFRLPAMLQWLQASAQGSPLPPLDGRLRTPALAVSGAVLEGVQIQIETDPPPTGGATAPR